MTAHIFGDVECIGPFPESCRITYNGYRVPYVSAQLLPDNRWDLTVDGRFSADFSGDELGRIIPLFACGMAVAAGHTWFGEGSQPANPWKCVETEIIGGRIIGPFDHYYLTYNGCIIPYITLRLISAEAKEWNVLVADRICTQLSNNELCNAAWLLANAMAVAAGYTYFGETSSKKNPFITKMTGITLTASELPDETDTEEKTA